MADVELRLEWEPSGRRGSTKVMVIVGDDLLFVDVLRPASAKARTKFAKEVEARNAGIAADDIESQLLRVAKEVETLDQKKGTSPRKATVQRGALPEDLETFGTELWFARLLVAKHQQDLRFVGSWKKWSVFNERDGRWTDDDSGEVMRRAKNVVATDVAREIEALIEAALSMGEEGKHLIDFARGVRRKFNAATPLKHGIMLASSEIEVVATVAQWDRDPFLFNVANGTIELRTGELRPHDRLDYLRKRSPIDNDPSATAPTWERFLERVLPDPEVRDYLQRFLGYCLTGYVLEHLLHLFWGGGANGKTTLLEAIRYVMGLYFGMAPSSLLMTPKGERHPTEQTLLFGKRLVVAAESPEGGALNENLVKNLTGGDTISARRMREDFWEFEPTHKLVLATNHRPRIKGTDEGVWRRIRLIPFTVTIPEEERDPHLLQKLREEGPGILAWLVRGTAMYLERRLEPPASIRAACEEYRDSEDVLGEFVEERVIEEAGAFVSGRALHSAYRAWCDDNGVPENRRLAQRGLTERMQSRGFTYKRKHRGRGFVNIRLALDGEAPQPEDGPKRDAGVTHRDAVGSPASRSKDQDANGLAPNRDAVTEECRHIRIAHAHTCKSTEKSVSLRHLRHASGSGSDSTPAPDDDSEWENLS